MGHEVPPAAVWDEVVDAILANSGNAQHSLS
jgi:hypothetical protein